MIPPAFIDEPGLSGQPWWAVLLIVLALFVAGLWIAARLAGRFIGRLPVDYFVMPIEQIPRAPLWEQALGEYRGPYDNPYEQYQPAKSEDWLNGAGQALLAVGVAYFLVKGIDALTRGSEEDDSE